MADRRIELAAYAELLALRPCGKCRVVRDLLVVGGKPGRPVGVGEAGTDLAAPVRRIVQQVELRLEHDLQTEAMRVGDDAAQRGVGRRVGLGAADGGRVDVVLVDGHQDHRPGRPRGVQRAQRGARAAAHVAVPPRRGRRSPRAPQSVLAACAARQGVRRVRGAARREPFSA